MSFTSTIRHEIGKHLGKFVGLRLQSRAKLGWLVQFFNTFHVVQSIVISDFTIILSSYTKIFVSISSNNNFFAMRASDGVHFCYASKQRRSTSIWTTLCGAAICFHMRSRTLCYEIYLWPRSVLAFRCTSCCSIFQLAGWLLFFYSRIRWVMNSSEHYYSLNFIWKVKIKWTGLRHLYT